MDLSGFASRRYTPYTTPIEPLPRFSAALAASCPGGRGPEVWIKRDDQLGLFPGGNKTRKLESLVADALRAEGRRSYVIPGGGSNALGGLGYVACAQKMQQQWFEQGLHFDTLVVGSDSSGTHGGLLADFLGNRIDMPVIGVGVSRDPADQEPLVWKEAPQAVVDLIGAGFAVPRAAVQTVGGYWQPKYSVPNPGMVEAVQMLARPEGILLDPVYTGKVMAGLIGMARAGTLKAGERVLFLHTGGLPSLHAYEAVVLGS